MRAFGIGKRRDYTSSGSNSSRKKSSRIWLRKASRSARNAATSASVICGCPSRWRHSSMLSIGGGGSKCARVGVMGELALLPPGILPPGDALEDGAQFALRQRHVIPPVPLLEAAPAGRLPEFLRYPDKDRPDERC